MINLDELRRDEITDGATYAETSVFLSVSSCSPEISNITITPTGTPDTSNTLLFKNTADPLNSAEGVALRLMDQDGVVLPPSGELSVPVNITQGNGSYNFRAGYAGNGTSITSGYFSAVVSLKLDYK